MKVKAKPGNRVLDNQGRLHLPREYPWKVLRSLLLDLSQFLSEEDIKTVGTILRHKDVAGYLSLAKEWGLQSFTPQVAGAFQRMKARYTLASLLKKFQFVGSKDARTQAALKKFYAAEGQCTEFNREGWKRLFESEEQWVHVALFHAREFMRRLLGDDLPESSDLVLWSRHGPGATTDTVRGMISKYNKYLGFPYQCTAAAYRFAKAAISNDERWLGALEDQYRQLNGVSAYAILDRKAFWSAVLQIVDGAEIRFVPKNAETFRTITIEPTMNIYLQLGVDGFVRRRLKRWGVDLDNQEKNQRLARSGSLHWEEDDPYVTLDLSAASDTISRKIVEILLPVEWYLYLLKLRSPLARLGLDELENVIYFSKFSAMGNGFTFCLESAIFTSMVYGVQMATNGAFSRNECAIFGDDLVVRESISKRLIAMLNLCGFTVNEDKSFFSGPVRESCGTDWSSGLPVRPVFLEDVPTDVKQLFSARNRLKRMLDVRFGIEESETVRMMDRWVPEIFGDCLGPYSDTEFDTYLHSARRSPINVKIGGVRVHKRVLYEPVLQRKCNLLSIRKLMHSLRADLNEEKSLYSSEETGTGSEFTVHLRTKERAVRTTFSDAWEWRLEYAEALPA